LHSASAFPTLEQSSRTRIPIYSGTARCLGSTAVPAYTTRAPLYSRTGLAGASRVVRCSLAAYKTLHAREKTLFRLTARRSTYSRWSFYDPYSSAIHELRADKICGDESYELSREIRKAMRTTVRVEILIAG